MNIVLLQTSQQVVTDGELCPACLVPAQGRRRPFRKPAGPPGERTNALKHDRLEAGRIERAAICAKSPVLCQALRPIIDQSGNPRPAPQTPVKAILARHSRLRHRRRPRLLAAAGQGGKRDKQGYGADEPPADAAISKARHLPTLLSNAMTQFKRLTASRRRGGRTPRRSSSRPSPRVNGSFALWQSCRRERSTACCDRAAMRYRPPPTCCRC